MPWVIPYLFVSYARPDVDNVLPLVEAIHKELRLRHLPVELWMDRSHLQPGENWNAVIAQALQISIGFLFFVSEASITSHWVRYWLDLAANTPDRLILPIWLDKIPDLPMVLARRQAIIYSRHPTAEQITNSAKQIATAVQSHLDGTPTPPAIVSIADAPAIAADIAQTVRTAVEPTEIVHNSVFVVHGHNLQALAKLEEFLASAGIAAVVLSRQEESPQSLFQKFMSVASKARFAIVLLCADDYGASRKQYDTPDVADRALQFRARQNVILELGFFYGHLGWESVFVVYSDPDRVFPNFERPSDLDGVVFASMSDVEWKEKLGAKLSAAGFVLRQAKQ